MQFLLPFPSLVPLALPMLGTVTIVQFIVSLFWSCIVTFICVIVVDIPVLVLYGFALFCVVLVPVVNVYVSLLVAFPSVAFTYHV